MFAGRGEQLLVALSNHGNPAVCKTSAAYTRGNNRNLHYFSPGGKNFADKTTPVLGSKNGPQNGGQVARTQANEIETE